MGAVPAGIGAILRDPFGHDHRRREIHFHAADVFRQEDAREPQSRRFPQNADRDAGLMMLNGFNVGRDFVVPKVFGGFGDRAANETVTS